MCYGQKPRTYTKVAKPTLDLIGIKDFDKAKTKKDLNFDLEKAYKEYSVKLKTTDTKIIKQVIKAGIVKDVRSIIVRNQAIQYREN